ncbi:MAG: polyprenyl synthetase family protein [Paracoccaceae bacterium]
MSFPLILKSAADAVNARLGAALENLPPSRVREAMIHAVHGGKGLRGFLVLESAALHGVDRDAALNVAAGIEALHAYSLVHDDLPAMDDDDMRRGRPTVHIAFDEATAILAGDALHALAFELCATPGVPNAAELVYRLARGVGAAGTVLGQAMDIEAETAATPLTLEQITRLQHGKTGELFIWSCAAGPVMAGEDAAALTEYAEKMGLAFQIADDILDVEGDAATAGKRLQKDAEAGKATFVSLLGLEPARQRARDLIDEACAALTPYGDKADALREAARFVINRDK